MEIHQLRYFLALVEAGSFSKAAQAVHVTQPSLSQQIAKLEAELGHALFDRLPRGVVLTQVGEDLRAHATRILAEVRDASRRIAERGAEVGGRLVVGAIPTLSPYVLPRLLQDFCRAHPRVNVEIIEEPTAGLVRAVEDGEIDLALASAGRGSNAIHFERVGGEELTLLLPNAHPLAKKRAVRWSDLDGESFLLLQDIHCLAGQTMHFCDVSKVRPKVVVRACQLETLVAMAKVGVGISLVPELLVRAGLPDGLCHRPFVAPKPTRDLTIVTNVERFQTRAVQAFVALARKHLSALFQEEKAPRKLKARVGA